LGTFHGSDILTSFGLLPGFASSTIQSYYLSFVNTLDPNNGTTGLTDWPKWTVGGRELLQFNAASNDVIRDNFREESYQYLLANEEVFQI